MAETMYELAGGAAGIRRLTDRFYTLVFADDLLAPLFHQHGDHHADRLAMWLTELLGGPAEHSEHRGGFEVMAGAHHHLKITEPQRARWAALMFRAAEEVDMPAEFRRRLVPYIEGGSTFALRVSWPVDRRGPR
jgi:truncated hemoglobin YjbI